MKVYCVNQYNMLTVNNRDFTSDWTPDATSTSMFLFENRHYFFSSLAYCPHVACVAGAKRGGGGGRGRGEGEREKGRERLL